MGRLFFAAAAILLFLSLTVAAKEWTETENGVTYRCYDDPTDPAHYRWCVAVAPGAPVTTQPGKPTPTTSPPPTENTLPPGPGNSKCDPQVGENCRTSGECTCLGGQTCEPGHPKALPSGCVSPYDAIRCPLNAVPYGTQCVCKEGYAWNAAMTECAKKAGPASCKILTDCPGKGAKYCDGAAVYQYMCFSSSLGCQRQTVQDCGKEGLACQDAQCVKDQGGCNRNTVCEASRGENCANCKADCGACPDCDKYCSGRFGDKAIFTKMTPENKCDCECDLGYEWSDDYTKCQQKKKAAYIFISNDQSWRHKLFSQNKIRHIKDFYKGQGYEVWTITVNGRDDMLKKMTDPDVKAIAYFGHGDGPDSEADYEAGKVKLTPTIENLNGGKELVAFGKQAMKDKYVGLGVSNGKADQMVAEKFKGQSFNMDYVYMHSCYSLDDDSMADSLLRPGGTYWGHKGKLNPAETMTEYKRPGGP